MPSQKLVQPPPPLRSVLIEGERLTKEDILQQQSQIALAAIQIGQETEVWTLQTKSKMKGKAWKHFSEECFSRIPGWTFGPIGSKTYLTRIMERRIIIHRDLKKAIEDLVVELSTKQQHSLKRKRSHEPQNEYTLKLTETIDVEKKLKEMKKMNASFESLMMVMKRDFDRVSKEVNTLRPEMEHMKMEMNCLKSSLETTKMKLKTQKAKIKLLGPHA